MAETESVQAQTEIDLDAIAEAFRNYPKVAELIMTACGIRAPVSSGEGENGKQQDLRQIITVRGTSRFRFGHTVETSAAIFNLSPNPPAATKIQIS